MALTKVTGHVVLPTTNIEFHNTKSTGIVTFTDTTQSTSTTTGALQIAGGVGIVKNLNVGGNLNVTGNLTYTDVDNINSVGIITANAGVILKHSASGKFGQLNSNAAGAVVIKSDPSNNADNSSIQFHIDNDEKVRISKDGSVGIGSTTPLSTMALDVVGSIRFSNQSRAATGSNATPSYAFYGDHDTGMYRGAGVNILSFATGGSERLKIDAGGAVSVLETGDNKGLRVHTNSGVSATNNELRFNTGQSSGFTFMTNSDGTSSNERLRINSSGTIFVNGDGTGGRIFASGGSLSLTDGNGRQTLRIDDPGSGNTHINVFNSSGNLGIGTTNPQRKLHIKDAGQIKLESTATGSWIGLDFLASSGTNNYDAYMGVQDSDGLFFIDNNSNGIDFSINQAGQIAIGAIAPDTWSTGKAITIGTVQATLWGTGDQINLSGNAYFNSGWKAAATKAGASQIQQALGQIDLRVTGSINADAAITWVNGVRITKAGLLRFGPGAEGNTETHITAAIFQNSTGTATTLKIGNTNTPSSANNRAIEFCDGTGGTEGSSKYTYARIKSERTGGSNAGRIIFSTKPDNDNGPSEALRIEPGGHISMRRSVTPLSGVNNTFSFNLYRDSGTGYGYIDAVTNSSNTAGVKIRGYSNTVYTNAFDHYAGVTKLAAGTIADRITLGSREITIKTNSYPETTEYLAVFNAGVANGNRFKNRYIKIRNNYTGSTHGGVPIVWEANADGSNNKSYGAVVTEGNGDIRFLNAPATSEKAIGTDLLGTISEKLRITKDGNVGIRPGGLTDPTAGDMATGASQNAPLLHVRGSGSSDTGGEYNLLARFQAGGDSDGSGAMIVLNHDNDRGLAIEGGRRTGNYAHGALRMIDNVGRLSDVMKIHGGAGQGVDHISLFTGISTTTTERVTITSGGNIGINDDSPSSQLVVKATTDDNPSIRMYRQSTGGDIAALIWTTGSGNQAMINYRGGGGDVGMQFYTNGTSSSDQKLRISTNGQILQFANAGDNQFVSKRIGNAGSNGDYFFHMRAQNSNDNTVGELGFHRDTALDDARFIVKTRNTSGSSTERLRITSTGHLLVANNSYYLPHSGNFAANYVQARYFTVINHASGQNWGGGNGSAVSSLGAGADTNTGGNFASSGGAENNLGYVDGWGLIPFGGTWRAQNNDTGSNFDGGWSKYITNLPGDDWTYMSTILVRRVGSNTSGSYYHGCDWDNTLYQNGNTQSNPYFMSFGISTLPQDIWCLSIGFITGNAGGDNGDAGANTAVGLWRLDTGQKLYNGDWFRMKNGSTQQVHRTYLYYSTNSAAHLQWRESGFYTCDGSEPSISQLSHGRLCFKAGTGIVPVEDA